MQTSLIIFAPEHSQSDLFELLYPLKFELEGVKLKAPDHDTGLSIDPGTVAIVFDLVKVTLPALITAVGTIWAAKHAVQKKQKKEYHKARVVITLTSGSVLELNIGEDGTPLNIGLELPENPNEVSYVRLEV